MKYDGSDVQSHNDLSGSETQEHTDINYLQIVDLKGQNINNQI